MANMFAVLARKATIISTIMENRDKITTEDIIRDYPEGITINGFDLITTPNQEGVNSTYPVITFSEDDSKFLYGGKALMDIVSLWVANFDGDIETTSNALKAAGGVKIKMTNAKTKQGRNFTRIDVIG